MEIKPSVPSEGIFQAEFGLCTFGCYSDILWVLVFIWDKMCLWHTENIAGIETKKKIVSLFLTLFPRNLPECWNLEHLQSLLINLLPSGILSSAAFPIPKQTLAFSVTPAFLCKKYEFKRGQIEILRPSLSLFQWNSLAGKQNGLSGSCAPALGELCLQLSPQGWISPNISAVTQHSLLLQQKVVHLPRDGSKDLQNLFFFFFFFPFHLRRQKNFMWAQVQEKHWLPLSARHNPWGFAEIKRDIN